MADIWEPIKVGDNELTNRLALAPMTRSRALPDGSPTPLMAEYYKQRAGLGLLITEGVQPSDEGQGYPFTPGLYRGEHIAGWKAVADEVHAAGSRIFAQVMHVGRMAHPANRPDGGSAVAPSPVPLESTQMFTPEGMQDAPVAREMTEADIERTIADYVHTASTSVAAGLDGIELHGANGYLINQFLSAHTNRRTDGYGGSIENRIRFAVEVASATVEAVGGHRIGIRLSPGGQVNEAGETDEYPELYLALVRELAPLGLAYLHLAFMRDVTDRDEQLIRDIRAAWPGVLILNRAGTPADRIGSDIAAGLADIESVGQLALANPDLPRRLREKLPLNEADSATFFGGTEKGYTDYPFYAD
ncbi:alkene reductase [Pseudonocardiaceae bacterium YIM PH 21723]|nr:alkene reductase [Pseudonocardiaceae bacterium YIM PH 21723]